MTKETGFRPDHTIPTDSPSPSAAEAAITGFIDARAGRLIASTALDPANVSVDPPIMEKSLLHSIVASPRLSTSTSVTSIDIEEGVDPGKVYPDRLVANQACLAQYSLQYEGSPLGKATDVIYQEIRTNKRSKNKHTFNSVVASYDTNDNVRNLLRFVKGCNEENYELIRQLIESGHVIDPNEHATLNWNNVYYFAAERLLAEAIKNGQQLKSAYIPKTSKYEQDYNDPFDYSIPPTFLPARPGGTAKFTKKVLTPRNLLVVPTFGQDEGSGFPSFNFTTHYEIQNRWDVVAEVIRATKVFLTLTDKESTDLKLAVSTQYLNEERVKADLKNFLVEGAIRGHNTLYRNLKYPFEGGLPGQNN